MTATNDACGGLRVYNTMTRRKEEFQPLEPGKVRMYNCGPTVYDYFHVGNARNFVVADVMRRHLESSGCEVRFVQNITDIEDKIINRAKQEGVSPEDIAAKYTQAFFNSAGRLGVRPADEYPRATDYVKKMIEMVKTLEAKGYAYPSEGDVYFRVAKFEGYGKLSGRKVEDLLSGARVEVSEKKESPTDFTLWKAAKPGEPSWDSPWGPGRPGWHLECSVMSMDLLGETFDIHLGGNDLIFPHHENEIAQSEAATGKCFARYWLHNGFLKIDGEKMSKSLGNFFTIDDILEKFEPIVVRYFLLSAHYRGPLDFSDQALKEAATALSRLHEARATARRVADGMEPMPGTQEFVKHDIGLHHKAFKAHMDDDFNTPNALADLFEIASEINRLANDVLRGGKYDGKADDDPRMIAALLGQTLDQLGGEVLGLELDAPPAAGVEDLSEQLLDLLIDIRLLARKEKQWPLADRVRDGLAELGFELKDLPGAKTEWKRKS